MIDIIVECKPDEALMRALGYTRKRIFHQPNKAEVIKYLIRNPRAIGIVDEDPGAANVGYFSKFRKIGAVKFGLEQFVSPGGKSPLIVIKPRLEEWILSQANSCAINPQDYSLPSSPHQLHKNINEKLPEFEKMLGAMQIRKNAGLAYLKALINLAC
jgi:hypothetical protein